MSLRPGGGGRKGGGEERIKKYKAGVDAEVARRRREEGLVEIRKRKRDDTLAKRRMENAASSSAGAAACATPAGAASPHGAAAGLPSQVAYIELGKFSEMAWQLWSADVLTLLDATSYFRNLLSIGQNPPINAIIKAGVLPRIVQLLLRKDMPLLQFEAAWTLTSVASGTSEHTQAIIELGAVPILVQLLSSPSEDVREQAVCALGHVVADSTTCRDHVLENGVIIPLLTLLNPKSRLSMLRIATWTLANIVRGKASLQTKQIKPVLSVLQQLIHSNDDDILTCACMALSHLSIGTNEEIQAVIDANVCTRLVELIRHPIPSVLLHALRTVGNIITGDDTQTQFVIDTGVLFCLLQLLTQSHPKTVKKDACWVISNITAGNKAQIQAVLDANIIPPLVHLLEHAEFDIKKEAAWAISNAITGGSFEQVRILASGRCIKPLCDLLTCPDTSVVIVCLEALENILKVGKAEKYLGNNDGINPFAHEFEDCEGLDKIENLQSHDNEDIYEKVINILEKYLDEEEEEGENLRGSGVLNCGFESGLNAASARKFEFF